MAYSRWSTSRWYVYWEDNSSTVKNDQIVAIANFPPNPFLRINYKDLKEDSLKSFSNIKLKIPKHFDEVSTTDLEELIGYLQFFIKDVELDDSLS